MTSRAVDADTIAPPRWSVGGLLLEAVAARDFLRLGECFEPTATMRALLPPGLTELAGAPEIVAAMRQWFGEADDFQVLDGTVGEVGGRLHVAWRLRLRPAPSGEPGWHVAAQQAYVSADDRIDAIDLLCSGFHPEPRTTSRRSEPSGNR